MDRNYYQDEEFEEFEEEQELYFEDDYLEQDEQGEGKASPRLKMLTIAVVIVTAFIGIISYGFKVEEIRVIGNRNYTSDEILELIGFPEDNANTLFSYLRYLRYNVDEIPFLENIDVKIESSNVLCIEVDETHILACIKDGKKYYYFDDDGIVREILTECRDTLPVIEGVDFEVLELDTAVSVSNRTIFEGVMELCQLLSDYALNVQKIDVNSEGAFTVIVDDTIRIALGAPVLLEEKAAEIANILPELRKMQENEDVRGILHLENYDSTKKSIVFTKEN